MSLRDSISLIANTGLQFYRFEAKIGSAMQKDAKFRFVEKFDATRRRFWLDEAVQISSEDEWVAKSQLLAYNYLSKSGKLSDDIDRENLKVYDASEIYEIGNISKVFSAFEKKWIPLPFFSSSKLSEDQFGPVDWVRIFFERIDDEVVHFSLLVDTSVVFEPGDFNTPFLSANSNENLFALTPNDQLAIAYCDSQKGCRWVEDYMHRIFQKPGAEIEKPFLKHIANYVFFVRILRSLSVLPTIQLVSNTIGLIDVDLVVDVGNSNTCAILFENPTGMDFKFNSVKKLEIQDFSNPMKVYNDSFSTRIVFKDTYFSAFDGEINQNNKFIWPSPVRIGFEAENTINHSAIDLKLNRQIKTSNSSPKRYLWDNKSSSIEWEYHVNSVNDPPRKVYKKGVSEQLNSDGSFNTDDIFGTEARFSRRSLMTFVYLEIFSHALRQINSIDFRTMHGNPSFRRKIKRVVVSCPTGMIQSEQIALRKCADDALKILNKLKQYNNVHFGSGLNAVRDIYDAEISIIPSVKDLMIKQDELEKRSEWMYDEATAAQMVFLYGMVYNKFGKDAQKFFDVFASKSLKSTKKNTSIRIASLDIGGGTTDLMICEHVLSGLERAEIVPTPLFWESFHLAGDDLLQQIIQQIIIEGQPNNEAEVGCTGVIEHHLRQTNPGKNVGSLLNGFFGSDSNKIGYRGRLMRTNFINQIALPIAGVYYAKANQEGEQVLGYSDIFGNRPPSSELLDYFNQYFGFRFEELQWKITAKAINKLCEQVFNKLFYQIGQIVRKYDCEVVVLSGRPFSLKGLESLWNRNTHLLPNRVVNLNSFWVGRWYPFSDSNGFVDDPKTIVAVGSLISLMGGSLFKLGQFRINTTNLKTNLVSTVDYVGRYKDGLTPDVYLSPDHNEFSIKIHSLPFLLGSKKVNSPLYHSSVLYAINLNEEKIGEIVQRKQFDKDFDQVFDSAEDFKFKIRSKMPVSVNISRDYADNKEVLKIEEVTDFEGNEIPKTYFELSTQTLTDPSGYWLDTGEFILSSRS